MRIWRIGKLYLPSISSSASCLVCTKGEKAIGLVFCSKTQLTKLMFFGSIQNITIDLNCAHIRLRIKVYWLVEHWHQHAQFRFLSSLYFWFKTFHHTIRNVLTIFFPPRKKTHAAPKLISAKDTKKTIWSCNYEYDHFLFTISDRWSTAGWCLPVLAN